MHNATLGINPSAFGSVTEATSDSNFIYFAAASAPGRVICTTEDGGNSFERQNHRHAGAKKRNVRTWQRVSPLKARFFLKRRVRLPLGNSGTVARSNLLIERPLIPLGAPRIFNEAPPIEIDTALSMENEKGKGMKYIECF